MKNIFSISFILVASLFVSAQQKNTLLEQSFWKTAPDVASVQAEIAKGNNPSASNDRSFDAVVIAINNDAPNATIKFLLEQPGNGVNKPTHDNRIYLHWAAGKGNQEIVEYLIAKGSDLNLEDSHGALPITAAASNGVTNTAVYEAFFKAGVDPKKKYTNETNLLLMAIPFDKNLALTDYFVTKGMSLKDIDKDGSTAFDYATKTGNLTLLKSILEKGVKPTDNALLIAAQGSRRDANTLETYKYLVEDLKLKPTATNSEGQNALHFLVTKPKQTEIISYFLSKGVDANKSDNDGNTPLIVAASGKESYGTVEQLIPLTKNINAQNKKGESALTKAIQSGTNETATLLLEKGADAKVLDKDENNLGFYLIDSYRPQMGMGRGPETGNAPKQDPFDTKTKLLQDKGLNLSTPQKDGNTLYHFAVAKNDLTLLKKIADLNIDINAKNKDGLTALHKAAMISKDDTLLKYLLSIGAKKEIATDFDESPYALAKENESLTKNKTDLEFLK
ncbi:ankyrin repeat domain-containing protein [Flavobacterium taihuense]|uniref:Ankyrin repeat domain-containing protein n=1 Tax=Flavobacterium taihuense TaxID=2857508 RepID=A0ABS6XY67_9FLAO|nr:ankyrin repeat domain-containing protein [Flavobacterium taihuense]MBW4361631.1 ankyrin repeat domain-containing protein [Flavobacterium taihuense]